MDNKLLGLFAIFFLSFVLFISIVVFKVTPFSIKADTNAIASGDNSILLVWPLTLKIADKEKATVTIFIRSADSKPLLSRSVTFKTTSGTLEKDTLISDENGKVSTSFTCTEPGTAEISGIIDNSVTVTQHISVTCE